MGTSLFTLELDTEVEANLTQELDAELKAIMLAWTFNLSNKTAPDVAAR